MSDDLQATAERIGATDGGRVAGGIAMTDDNDAPTCPDCGHSLMAISPWWYVCQKLTCQKKVPRYEWVEEESDAED